MGRYRVVIQEQKCKKAIIHEDINHSEMLRLFAEYHETSYLFKIYESTEGGFWKVKSISENGEIIRYKDIVKKPQENSNPPIYGMGADFSFVEFFENFFNAHPSRSENIGTLIVDVLNKEDVSKPKLTLK
ncbi:hypothetical protein ABD87_14665 [Lysinibacillus sphaericus]|uniref:hypothetical protein n=1 Tax=Lysinibacillus sphaericus TaxID=1421 RepID=UPI0018CF3CCA|nr:hypothetical protein [Lysinibacillus sphaericus]MBG9730743.1 hypothetical protein [Lysinibacillus sphaericus]